MFAIIYIYQIYVTAANYLYHKLLVLWAQLSGYSQVTPWVGKPYSKCYWLPASAGNHYTTRLVRGPAIYTATQSYTGGHRTRVAAVILDNMAEDAVAASASLRQILTVSARYCGPAFVSWLSMLWDTLTRKPELQWFVISPQYRLKVSRGDEGVGHVCFPGDEGVGRPWRGYRYVQMNVDPAWYLELLVNLGLCIYFWIQNPI